MKFGLFLGTEYPARRSMTARGDSLIEQVRPARDPGFDCALAGIPLAVSQYQRG